MGKTLFDKVWEEHVVDSIPNGPSILYIDKHLIHEVTSPQAFDGINSRKINVFSVGIRISSCTPHDFFTLIFSFTVPSSGYDAISEAVCPGISISGIISIYLSLA